MGAASSSLLVAADANPVTVDNPGGLSPILLLGDHAGCEIPARLGDLGLSSADMQRHIACDIGVAGLGAELSRRLDATFIHQRFSRLVIDCNRAPGAEGSIAVQSDGSHVAGNAGINDTERQQRVKEVFQPYHDRVAAELDARFALGRRTILVSLHSFTPALANAPRPWRFGVLHRHDSSFSYTVLADLRSAWGEEVGDNQPYAMDEVDHTIPFHADRRGLDYLELEVRQDLIANLPDQICVARSLVGVLARAAANRP